MTRYRWKSGLPGQIPPGIERGRCYDWVVYADERGRKPNVFNLLGDDGHPVARQIPVSFLEECEDDEAQR